MEHIQTSLKFKIPLIYPILKMLCADGNGDYSIDNFISFLFKGIKKLPEAKSHDVINRISRH